MSTPHNEAKPGDFAKTVIMPGDPLRAKYISEKFLVDSQLVKTVRGIYAYTGTYKGKKISIMASGMGIPSMGIYSYELFKFYDVENIIRIGSCGGLSPDLKLFDIVLSNSIFSESNYAFTFNNDNCHIVNANSDLNNIIYSTATEQNISIIKGNTICSDCFDVYMSPENVNKYMSRFPDNFNPLSAEMEAFALCYNAQLLNKKATCLMTVVDSKFIKDEVSSEQREKGLDSMIKLALESAIKL